MVLSVFVLWTLCWHLVQNAKVDSITSVFRVSAQLGDIPDLTAECAVKCSLEETCVGFDVSANECTLLNLPNAEPELEHTLYLSQDRIEENVPPCTPIAARVSDDDVFVTYFSTVDPIYYYSAYHTDAMEEGDVSSSDTFSETYPQLGEKQPRAVFRYYGDLYFIIGTSMEVYEWNDEKEIYALFAPHYPRSLEDEMGDVPIPSSVNAADVNDSTLYMIQGNTVYSYSVEDWAPDIVYEFLGQFDVRENGALNPFSAGPGSLLDHPPSWITAMVFCDDDSVLLAYSYKDIYLFSAGNWEYKGEVFTPCD